MPHPFPFEANARRWIAPAELSRSMGDPDAVFRRFDGPPVVVDLAPQTWRDDLRDLWADVRGNPDILAIGIIIGCLTTVGLAFVWSLFL